eukprot:gene17319-26596_t
MAYKGKLVSDVVGPRLAALFPFTHFNKVQTQCVDDMYNTDESMVVAAPTGSGKTVLMELAILRLFKATIEDGAKSKLKAVYIAPIKALANEKAASWASLFEPFGIEVRAVTGDTGGEHEQHMAAVLEANVVVTTPEKFDSVTRRWTETVVRTCVREMGLILIDEVHLVGEARGAVMEAVVSRMKQVRSEHSTAAAGRLRFVAVSATMANARDIGRWLGASPQHVCVFPDSDRPVPLSIEVIGFERKSSPFMFEKYLMYRIPGLIMDHGDGKPVLIFCSTRKSASMSASHVSTTLTINGSVEDITARNRVASRVSNKQLAEAVRRGVAFHHAGLSPLDKQLVEGLFFSKQLLVLCTTSTLAMGVNLPARLVIVKGTMQYNNGHYESMSPGQLLQMA